MEWRGIMKVIHIQHLNVDGKIVWEQKNIRNMLHTEGEEFLLRAAFAGGSEIVPENYYLGLDNRSVINSGDTMDDLLAEPTTGGYSRQPVSSVDDFSISLEEGHIVALSPVVVFRAISGSWGPVSNLFITDKQNNSGFLISTATLGSAITVAEGDSVTLRFGMQLKDCQNG